MPTHAPASTSPEVSLPPRLEETEHWYQTVRDAPYRARITEPFVDEFLRANLWLLVGSTGAALIDCGLGISPILPVVRELIGNTACPVILTHGHLDHAGGAAEFVERYGHPADEVSRDRALSLGSAEHAQDLGLSASELAVDGDWLISRLPRADFLPQHYVQRRARLTRQLRDGDMIDLGDVVLEVLHLPGHTPGSIALYDRARSELYSGDIIYDDELLDSLPESHIAHYRASLTRLHDLAVTQVFPGHGPSFDGARMREIIDAYLAGATAPR